VGQLLIEHKVFLLGGPIRELIVAKLKFVSALMLLVTLDLVVDLEPVAVAHLELLCVVVMFSVLCSVLQKIDTVARVHPL